MSMSNLWGKFFKKRLGPNKNPQTPEKKIRKRLFFALRPDESTRQELSAVLDLFPRQLSDNWTPTENLHIGLALAGGVEAKWLDDLKEAGAAVQAAEFELSLDRIAYWPHKRTLCLTPSSVPGELTRLVADLGRNLDDVGFGVEKRPYRTYLTLAREAAYPPPDIHLERPIQWKATSFALLESRPQGLGVAHSLVQAWPLAKPDGEPGTGGG